MPPATVDHRKEGPENGWTFATLLRHLLVIVDANDRRYVEMFVAADKAVAAALAAAEKTVQAALTAADRATNKAEESQLRVNTSQNEFRQQLKDQAAAFITRDMLDAVSARVMILERSSSGTEGSSQGKTVLWTGIAAVVSILVAIAAVAVAFVRTTH